MNFGHLLDSTTLADRLLFLSLIILSLAGILFVRELIPGERTVFIDSRGKLAYVLPLNQNRTISVEGPGGYTFVEIRESRVRIIDSPCPDKLCMGKGWIMSGSLVCLPNRVVVTIRGQEAREGDIDAVTR